MGLKEKVALPEGSNPYPPATVLFLQIKLFLCELLLSDSFYWLHFNLAFEPSGEHAKLPSVSETIGVPRFQVHVFQD
jgi:hypothetical protein